MAQSRIQVGRSIAPQRNDKKRRAFIWPSGKPARGASKTRHSVGAKVQVGARSQGGDVQAAPQTYVAAERLAFLSLRNFLVLGALAVVTVLLILGLVRSNHQAVAYSYEISALTQERLDVLERNRKLKMELATVTSLDQLELTAKGPLALAPPRKDQIVVID